MKKAVAIILLAAISPVLYAQLSLGAKGGMTVSNYAGITTESKASVSYKAGLSVLYMFSKFGVESGVYIMEAGSASTQGVLSTKDVMNGSQVYMSVKSRYIDVPISLIYRHPLSEDVRIVCNVGCYIAFGQGGISEINHSKGGFSQNAFDDFNGKDDPNFNDFTIKGGNKQDFGIAAGIGVDILSHFSISANYNLGLVNVYDQYPITQDKNIKNRIFWIALGYNFNL